MGQAFPTRRETPAQLQGALFVPPPPVCAPLETGLGAQGGEEGAPILLTIIPWARHVGGARPGWGAWSPSTARGPCSGSWGPGPKAFSHSVGLSLLNCFKKKKSCSERTLPDNTEGIFPRDRPKADSHLKTCPKWSCPSEQIPQACQTPLPTAPPPGPAAARPGPARPGPARDWASAALLSRASQSRLRLDGPANRGAA